MGYYTDYTLSIQGGEFIDSLELKNALDAITVYTWDEYSQGELSLSGVKWYDHETDMITLSKRYSTTIFLLEGDGEGSGDVWRLVILNGVFKRVRPIITWPEISEFDLTKA